MQYDKGKHCVFYHRYHLVWSTKYRYKVLVGDVRLRVREIVRQVCAENGVEVINGVLSRDHVHMFVSVPPKLSVSDLMRKMKGRSSHRVQLEFPKLKKRYWGRHFWGEDTFQPQTEPLPKKLYFSTSIGTSKILPTSGGSASVVLNKIATMLKKTLERPAALVAMGSLWTGASRQTEWHRA